VTGGHVWVRWTALGLLVMQLGWILALPPFRGIDEFDHVYRADAVAHGDWIAEPSAATRGTGAELSVSRSIVRAAGPECERLSYTGAEDCIGEGAGERVKIASGAGRYNPLYYALVGYPGSLAEGTASVYLMRMVSALLCTGLFAWALANFSRWARSRGSVALLLTITPMIVYSTSVVAPNGLEMVAGLGFWIALAGLGQAPSDTRRNLALAVVSGALLVTLRSLGPLWALLALLTALGAWPALRLRASEILTSRDGRIASVAGILASMASIGWILTQRSLVIGVVETNETPPLTAMAARASSELFLWPLQAIAAFPLRDQPAPMIVYANFLVVLSVVVLGAAIRSGSALRRAILVVVLLSFAIPWGITLATMATFGTAWQGRYALPFLVGASVLAGTYWAERTRPFTWRSMLPAIALVVSAHVVGPLQVLADEARTSPSADSQLWWQPSMAVLALVLVIGSLLLTVPAGMRSTERETVDA
jgi:hypothetical protein